MRPTAGRKEGGVKLLDIADQPLGYTAAKKRKKMQGMCSLILKKALSFIFLLHLKKWRISAPMKLLFKVLRQQREPHRIMQQVLRLLRHMLLKHHSLYYLRQVRFVLPITSN